MKSLVACLVFTLVALVSARADDYSFKETFDETHPFDAQGEVRLSNVNGTVTVRTWERNEVRIEGEKSAKSEEELKRIELTIAPSSSRLVVKVKLPRRDGGWFFTGGNIRASVAFTVTVPATARLSQIETVNGSILITDAHGPVHAESVNGRIEARGLAGDASLETVNGTITAEFATFSADQKISTETVNGSATILLPADASLSLDASCVNGSVDCDFPLTLKGSSSRRHIRGTIGTGAASLKAETVNGNIRVRQS